MGLLAVAPAVHVLHQLAQGLAGLGLAQGFGFGRGLHQFGWRQLRGFEGQAAEQHRHAVKHPRQAQGGAVGDVGDRTDHRQNGAGDRD